jgi:hypothetical protein
MDDKDKYKFLVEMGKGMDEMVESNKLLVSQKRQLMSGFEAVLFDEAIDLIDKE